MPVWLALIGLSFWLGLLRLPWWTILLGPMGSGGLGVYAVVTEAAGDDMHGFGYYIGGFVGVVCVAAWLLGRGAAALVRRGRGSTG